MCGSFCGAWPDKAEPGMRITFFGVASIIWTSLTSQLDGLFRRHQPSHFGLTVRFFKIGALSRVESVPLYH
ncbi:uncharacterized protein EI90DRAFT_3293547 [Cantharellus anzutake]|uniref:uncharacterized protein n=1 Tax=Cantharellus anzutake TaxID=1750568 RepID=UPI001908159A|nr:uncharacterized protein EI90DRAFT_3293547 [Cantharellus anzutake]KAF8316983.1 hypothetical protein EI90DRAFT_3293547 [Cantharellus anzutake]